jgi:hypothetical protein
MKCTAFFALLLLSSASAFAPAASPVMRMRKAQASAIVMKAEPEVTPLVRLQQGAIAASTFAYTMAPAMAQSEGTGRPLGIDDVRLPIALATVFLIVRQIYASWAVEQPDDTDFFGELDYRGDDRSGY